MKLTVEQLTAILEESSKSYIDAEQVKKDTISQKLSDAARGRSKTSEHRAKIGLGHKNKITLEETKKKISESKEGRSSGPQSKECNLKKAASLTPYQFSTPKGIFNSNFEMREAFKGEYIGPQLYRMCKLGINGFSRTKK